MKILTTKGYATVLQGTVKKIFLLLLKISVSGLLIYFVLKKTGLQNIVLHFRAMNPLFFLLSSCLYLLLLYIASRRWGLLLGGRHPRGRIYSLYLIGSFFSHILPGVIGGDTVKAYYLYKDTGKGGSSVGSVFLDRYIGSGALFLMGLVSGLVAYGELKALKMHMVIPIVFAVFIGGSLTFFKMRIGRRFSAVSDFYDYFHSAFAEKKTILIAFLLSMLIQLISISMVFFIALGLGQKLAFTALFVFVPVITVITMVPISISGLGLRESAFMVLFGLVGIPAGVSASISFLWFLSMAAASLIGLEEYLKWKRKQRSEADGRR